MKQRIPAFEAFINESKSYKLYLDDERTPRTSGWTIIRNADDAMKYIEKNGLPSEMSLDHDLGKDLPTGYDFVKWIVYDKEFDLSNIEINVHSANPVGKKNMETLISNWKKHNK